MGGGGEDPGWDPNLCPEISISHRFFAAIEGKSGFLKTNPNLFAQ